MKNKLKKAVVLGTVGTTVLSSIPNNVLVDLKAETVENEGKSGSVITPDVPTIEPTSVPTVTPTSGPVDDGNVTTPDVPTATPTNSPTPTPIVVSLDDLAVAVNVGGLTVNSIIYYKDSLPLSIIPVCTKEGISVDSVYLMDTSGNEIRVENNVVNIENLDGSIVNYTIHYKLSNGQNLEDKLGNVLKGTIKEDFVFVKDDMPPLIRPDKVTYKERNGYIYEDGYLSYTIADLDSGVKSISFSDGDGKELEYSNSGDGTVYFNTYVLPEGTSNIILTVVDNLDNSFSYNIELKILRSAPKLTGVFSSCIPVYSDQEKNKSYLDSPVTFIVSGTDNKFISKVELLKDGKVTQTILNNMFVISDSGKYTVRVTDVSGYATDYTLTSLFSEFKTNIVIDNENPILSENGTTSEIGKDGYLRKDGIVAFNVKDESPLKNLSVNEKNGFALNSSINIIDGTVEVDTSSLPTGSYTITVFAEDVLGNSDSITKTFKVLRETPNVITGVSHTPYTILNGKGYTKNNITFEIAGYKDSRISSVQLYKDGKYFKDFESGACVMQGSGTYSVVVTDIVGNRKVYRLEDLYKDASSDITLDTENPTSLVTINGEKNSRGWYTDDIIIDTLFKDNEGLKSAKVTINDTVIDYDLMGKLISASIDLKDVPKAENGVYNVSINVTDLAGNTVNSFNDTIKADFDDPTLGTLRADGNIREVNNSVFLQGNILVSGSAEDATSGVDTVELLKGDEIVSAKLPFSISDSGEYKIRVTDKSGRTITKELKTLLGTKSNNILCDNEPPVVEKVDNIKPDLVDNGINWFKSNPVFKYKATDDYIKSVVVYVNGKEYSSKLQDDSIYTIDTKGMSGEVLVQIVAEDYFGHVTSKEYSCKIDTKCPKLNSIELIGDYVERGGVLFFKSKPTLNAEYIDEGVGLKLYQLVGNNGSANTNGSFKLSTGEYSLDVSDKLGNSTGTVTLKSLLNLKSNKFIVDSKAPSVSVKKPKGSVNGWYADDVEYKVTLKDNQGIKSAKVRINGSVVDTYVSPNISTTEKVLNVNTSKGKADENGMYLIEVVVEDNAGNTKTWSDSLHIDRKAPKVEKFVFTGDGVQEGVNIGGSNKYGFYFQGSATCEIFVADGTISSGLDKLYVTYESSDGACSAQSLDIKNGTAKIKLPNDFKGFISAYATDKVGNKGKVGKPDGVILEGTNCFMNSVSVDISLPATEYSDEKGLPLYNKNITATAEVGSTHSGVKSVTWGIGNKKIGSICVDNNGNITGSKSSVVKMGKNLVVSINEPLNIDGNENSMEVWVEVTDRTGRVSKNSKKFSIDKDAPKIEVTYDKTIDGGFYKDTRVATISVQERNFDASKFVLQGEYGSLGTWSNKGDTWVNTLTFSEDGEYGFSCEYTDRAGNKSNSYQSESFTIDKTAPVLTVSWDKDNSSNGNFYNSARRATLTIVDKNFDGSKIYLEGSGSLSSWSSSGDTHTASIVFDTDGEYEFSVKGEDKAGNPMETYNSEKFIIDTKEPELSIQGVEEGKSYNGDVSVSVDVSDEYIDINKSSVTLKGRRGGEITLKGSLSDKTGKFVLSEFPKEESYDDLYTLTANIVDKAGNVVEKQLVFSVNRFGSEYTFSEENILSGYLNESKDISIVETNVDKIDTSKTKVSITLDGNEISIPEGMLSVKEKENDKGKYSYTYKISKDLFSKDGKYTIQVFSKSEFGVDYNSANKDYSFVLDTTAPNVIVSGIESNKKYHVYSKTVTFDIRETSDIKDIRVSLNGKEVALNKSNGIYSLEVLESNRAQSLEVVVEDLAGNKTIQNIDNVIITSNTWVYITNQSWFKWGIGGLIALFTALIALLLKGRYTSRRREEDILNQQADLYRSSSGSSDDETPREDLSKDNK